MSNPYNEAREKMAKTMLAYWIGVVTDEERDKLYEDLLDIASQILSLKGDGWRLALLGDEWVHSTLTPHRRVIWQGGE